MFTSDMKNPKGTENKKRTIHMNTTDYFRKNRKDAAREKWNRQFTTSR